MKRFIFLFSFFLFFSAATTFALEYTIEPSLSVSEEYNDNILLNSSDRIDDFITYISPGLGLSIRSLRSDIRLSYTPSFSFYHSHDEFDETAHSFVATGKFTLSDRATLDLSDTYTKSTEARDFRSIPDVDLGPITERIEREVNIIDSTLSYRLKSNLTFILGLHYSDYDVKESGFTDTKTYWGDIGLSYMWNERTSLLANARYTKYDFRPQSDATQQDYSLSLTHRFTPTLTASITGGPTIIHIEDTDETTTGFSGGIDLTKTFVRGEAVLSLRQDYIGSLQGGEPLRARSVSFRLTKPLTAKWDVSLRAAYGNYESVETDTTDTDDLLFDTGITYIFAPWATMTLSYSYIDSDDKIDDNNDYYNNIVFLTLRLSYSKRL